MEVYKAPQKYPQDNKFTIFLGGSIEMGKAELWQDSLTEKLTKYDVRVLNPRRDDYDAGQKQSINNPYFKEQGEWELDGLDRADLIVVYLQPDTLSPISIGEINLHINTLDWNKQMIICCPEGFWRKGNIEILVDRYPYHCKLVDTYQEFEKVLIEKLETLK